MTPSTPIFLASDTWILVALLWATTDKADVSLVELIRAADTVNHAIISRSELETGFARLVSAGHATCSEKRYAPSPAIREFWSNETKGEKSLYDSWTALGSHIGAARARSGSIPDTEQERYVSKEAYAAAVAGYAMNMSHPFLGQK